MKSLFSVSISAVYLVFAFQKLLPPAEEHLATSRKRPADSDYQEITQPKVSKS